MIILAIETSCDETAAAVVEKSDGKIKVLSSVVASSEKMHIKTGGIVPEVAAREQMRSMVSVIEECIKESKLKSIKEIEALAVTVGPGLIGSLLVGVETAKTLAYAWDKPVIPVNHLIAHLFVNFAGVEEAFPAIGMVVSGGHTDLVLVESFNKIKWLGGTRDDAAGECFDKSAKLLGLPYPGGQAISKMAKKGKVKLPRPLVNSKDYDFSFSGLKTAVLHRVKSKQYKISELAYEIQEAIVEVLVTKLKKAVDKYKPKSILLGGGVIANLRLREELDLRFKNYDLRMPPFKYCTDNAVMIGSTALLTCKQTVWDKLKVNSGLEIFDEI